MKQFYTRSIIIFTFLLSGGFNLSAQTPTLYIGLHTGISNTQVYSLNEGESFTSEGWGYNLGFYLRYGSRPFYQLGFDWMRSNNHTELQQKTTITTDKVPLHNFNVYFNLGYEIIHKPIFKWKAFLGPYIGKTTLKSTDIFNFTGDDFKSPQYGFKAGMGVQVTYLFIDLEYSYNLSNLFEGNFAGMPLDTHLEIFAIKIGAMF